MKQAKIIYYNANANTADISGILVSVIIPTYNRLEYIKRALASLTKQTYRHYETIVIDDASTDGTADWISKTLSDIKLIKLPHNAGQSRARNEGLKIAKGHLIAFLDSDDEWTPGYLANNVNALMSNPSASMSFCNYRLHTDNNGRERAISYAASHKYTNLVERLLLNQTFIGSLSMVVVRSDIISKAGVFNEMLRNCDDRDFYIRVFGLGNSVMHIPQTLVIKHRSEDNVNNDILLWRKSALTLLSIFFDNPANNEYKALEKRAKARMAVITLRYITTKGLNLLDRLKILFISICALLILGVYLKNDFAILLHQYYSNIKNRFFRKR